jgi:hypothetical protein
VQRFVALRDHCDPWLPPLQAAAVAFDTGVRKPIASRRSASKLHRDGLRSGVS